MQKKNYLIFYFTIFCLGGCYNDSTHENSQCLKIQANIEDARVASMNEWFESIEIARLETTSEAVFTKCNKAIYINDRFYILDEKRNGIFVFDKNGHYLKNSLAKSGSGPGEYYCIIDFDIDKQGNIEIFDASAYRIRKYDKEFNYISEWTLPTDLLPFEKFKILSPDLYAFYSDPTEKRAETIQIYSISKGKILKKLCSQSQKVNYLDSSQRNPFYSLNNQTYFTFPYPNNYISEINIEKLESNKVVEYDFGKYTFGIDKISQEVLEERDFILKNKNKYVFVMNKFENNEYYFAFTAFKDDMYIIKYNKQTKLQDIISWKFKDGGIIIPPMFIDDNFLYVITDPIFVKDLINLQLLDSNSKTKMELIQEDDNPVVLKYKLKH